MNKWEAYYFLDKDQGQGAILAQDFIKNLSLKVCSVIAGSGAILDIGCGTGELAKALQEISNGLVLGIDLSKTAIEKAKINAPNCRFSEMPFEAVKASFDLAVSSNLLEHYVHWRPTLMRWLQLAPKVLLCIPFEDESNLSPNLVDGGPCHSTRFNAHSFEDFYVIDEYLFKSPLGWRNGKNPRLWTVLLEAGVS